MGRLKEPVVQIAVNEAGTVLYQLTSNSSIHVTYLGQDDITFNTVSKKMDVFVDARRTNAGTNHLNKNDFKIVSIHPTSAESIGYHLVAVTSTGCRIYYNHHKDSQPSKYDDPPTGLVTIHVRTPSDQFTTSDRASHAIYNKGLLMLVKNQQADPTQDQIVTFSPDLGSLTNCTSTASVKLTEFYGAINIHGKVLAMVESPSAYKLNELTAPYNSPARHFLVLTTSGLSILVKQRPVDMLYRLIASAGQDVVYRLREFDDFFGHFGYVNSCSLCLSLICSASAAAPEKKEIYDVEPVTEVVEQGAKVLLERFGQILSSLNDSTGHQYTSRHDGLALFIYRVVGSIWDKYLVTVKDKVYSSPVSKTELKDIQKVMRKLDTFLEK
jgi:nuclear pore complex protein Nup155